MYLQFKHTEKDDEFIVDILHSSVIENGFTYDTRDQILGTIKVSKVLSSREPAPKTKANPNNVNHNPKGVMWYQVKANRI